MTASQPTELHMLRDELRAFAKERDWEQFHTPKNLASCLSVEAGELLAPFRWLKEGNETELTDDIRAQIVDELGDVFLCLVRLADSLDIELFGAARAKLESNAAKYPVDLVRGSARKYTEYK